MSFIQNGNKFSFFDVTDAHDKLPVGVYILKYDQREGFYLVRKEDFKLPKKIYGDQSIVDRWVKSLKNNTSKNLGILLTGLKGSGKTITAQKFCIDVQLPVILISEDFNGPEFLDFMSNVKLGKCVVFIDEYEKIYNKDENQFDLLSLMDGTFETQLIFLLTVNSYKINDYLVNRLGRIKYVKQYSDLEMETVNEVIDDMLIDKTLVNSIYEFFEKVNIRTFDILINLIKEMNLFGQDAIECGKHLNLRSEPRNYSVYEIINGVEYPCWNTELSPAAEEFSFERKDVNYLSKDNQTWEVELRLAECTVEKLGEKTKIITHPKEGVFRLKENSWGDYNKVF